MIRRLALLATLLLTAQTSAPGALPTSMGSTAFAPQIEQFVAEYEARDPLFADHIGIHSYDDELPDFAPAALAARRGWLTGWRARIAAAAPINLDQHADRTALLDEIDDELFEMSALDPNTTDPRTYVDVIGDAAYQLTSRAYAPFDERMAHLAKRVTHLPALVDAAVANLDRPTHVSTILAIDQNRGNIAEYDRLLDGEGASRATRNALRAQRPAVLAALHKLQTFLEGPLLARSDRDPRVGAAIFDRELVLGAGTDTPRAVLVARARADMLAARSAMYALALPLDHEFFPQKVHTETGAALIDAVVREVLDKLADDHPSADQLLTVAHADVARSEAFLASSGVVPLPSPDTLQVIWTPAFMAGLSGANLNWAGPFAPLSGSFFDIDRIPPTWDSARVTSYLREYNSYEIQLLTLHEAVPGHYVQGRANAENPSLVRRVFGNGSFIEGWAVYGEGMMLDAGYGNGDPRLRLFQLKWRLREYANAIIDAGFHAGTMSENDVVSFLIDDAFQERSEAENKWHRLQLSHDQLSTYFIGLDALGQAQAAERRRLGARFSLGEFNRQLLAVGSVEPRFVERLLAQ